MVTLLRFYKPLTDKFLSVRKHRSQSKLTKISPAIKMYVLWVIRKETASNHWWKFQCSGFIEEVCGPLVGYQTWHPPCPHSRISPSHPDPPFIIQVKPANDNPGTVTQWRKIYSRDSCNIKKKKKSNQNKLGIRGVLKRKEKECIVRNTSLPAHTMHCISVNLGEFLCPRYANALFNLR